MKTLLLFLSLLGTMTTFAQSLTFEKGRGGWQFREDGQILSKPVLQERFSTIPAAAENYQSYRSQMGLAGVLGGIGGVLIGLPLGTAIGGGDPNWWLAGIGAGVVVLAIPIESGAKKKARAAVAAHNASLGSVPDSSRPVRWRVVTARGLGLGLTF